MSISNNTNSIPFLDLVTPHVEMEQELTEIFRKVLRTAGFIGGPMVEEFEKAFAAFCGTSHSIASSSGTDALRFALIAAGVRAGDGIITVAHTFLRPQSKRSCRRRLRLILSRSSPIHSTSALMLYEHISRRIVIGPTRQACQSIAEPAVD